MYRDQGAYYDPRGGRYGNLQPYDYANWGYIILYLIIILGSFFGNGLFLWTIKKNPHLRKTPHFMLTSLAIRDLIVTILVVPFVIDSQAVNLMEWNAGDVMCKLFSFLNYGTMAAHSFTLVFLLLFLYFWYRKQESYMTEDGTTIVRKTRMHKWAIPLTWVIGLGLAIPMGALSYVSINSGTGVRSCAVWDGRAGSEDNGYRVAVSNVFVAFILPLIILAFPFIALTMQLCGAREPRLDPPHNRLAATSLGLVVIFAATRAPFEIYELMKLFHQSNIGLKANTLWGTPYAAWTFETDIVLNALIYVSCVIHPILYFALNPEYRKAMIHIVKKACCGKGSEEPNSQGNHRKSTDQNIGQQPRPIVKQQRGNQKPLVSGRQPQILPAAKKQHYGNQPQHLQQPLLGQPQVVQPNQILFPEHHLQQGQPNYLLPQGTVVSPFGMIAPGVICQPGDLSFERLSPQLPAVFEYNDFKYIDTARVEPRIAYSPEKTPPKTPETPHFGRNPFPHPVDEGPINTNIWAQQPLLAQSGLPPASVQNFEMKPIATSETKQERRQSARQSNNFELENLDVSPGNTLRDRRRLEELGSPNSEVVEMLDDSPNARRRKTQEGQQRPGTLTNGRGTSSMAGSRDLGDERPSSRASTHNVEILITGRTRSRTDLCPDVPRSKFEHCV